MSDTANIDDVLKMGSKITVAPVIHGSGDFAIEVRRMMLAASFDCVAVPLPPSFQHDVEEAIERLPTPAMVCQKEPPRFDTSWSPDKDIDDEDEESWDDPPPPDDDPSLSYVPIDPCQPVIAALRSALGEHIERAFIDLETARFQPNSAVLPDPYALKQVALHRFAAAILPSIPPPEKQQAERIAHMAARLRELEQKHKSILLVCSVLDWPWIRDAYAKQTPFGEHDLVEETATHHLDPKTLTFLLGELPFITGLYERARNELEDDQNLSVDGVKELLITARDRYRAELKGRARRISPFRLRQCLKYIRNLTLLERRLTPDLYTLVIAAKQMAGDGYALHLTETARDYPYGEPPRDRFATLGIEQIRLPDGDVFQTINRLPGPPVQWRSCELQRRPEQFEKDKWEMRWNPYQHCSWPPEDELIENFRAHVFDRAKAIMNFDLAKSEKFTTSIQDGIDIRETLRHWYDGEIYVKKLPPARGDLDAVVMLFEAPLDPRDFPWRTTWFAEHEEESTLAFCATDYRKETVGPGIGLATYGGALFLYPPIPIPDIWEDPRLDFTTTMEERLLAAAFIHSKCRQIALLSPAPPGAGWRRLAKHHHKTLVHVPLGQFSESTVAQLRMAHVLNGREVRSYASHFIRKA